MPAYTDYPSPQPIEMSMDEARFWKQEIKSSLKFQKDEFIKRIDYEMLVRYFEGLQAKLEQGINHLVILDEISPGISSIISSTYYQNPSVSVKPNHPKATGNIEPPLLYLLQNPDFEPYSLVDLLKSTMTKSMDTTCMKDAMQMAIFDLLVAGFCAIEENIVSEPNYEEIPEDEISENPEFQKPFGQNDFLTDAKQFIADPFGTKDKEEFTLGMSNEEVEEYLIKSKGYQVNGYSTNQYTERWSPLEILFDSRANYFKKSRFIGKIVKKSVAEFNVRYPKYAGQIPSECYHDISYSSAKQDKDKKGVTLYQLEIKVDKTTCKIATFAEGIPSALDCYYRPFTTNAFSIKYGCLDKYGKIYPMSRMRKAVRSQDAINTLGTQMMEHAMRANRKVAYDKNLFDDDGQSALKSSDVYAMVPKKSGSTAFEKVPQDTTTPDNTILQGLIRETLNKNLGVSELAKHGKSDNEFATQDMLENQAFEVSTSQIQDALEDVANEILDVKKDIILQFYEENDYFQVTGSKGGQFWYDPSMGPLADILIGDYLVTTTIASAKKPNPMQDRQEKIELAKFQMETEPFLIARGKRYNTAVIESVLKSFDINPESAIEDIEPELPAQPPLDPSQAPLDVPPGQAVPNPEEIIGG